VLLVAGGVRAQAPPLPELGRTEPMDIGNLDPQDFRLGPDDSGTRLSERMDHASAFVDEVNALGGAAGQAASVISAAQSARDVWQALDDLDAELDGQIGDDGAGPEVPSSCAENAACNECFERAYGEVNFVRNTLVRLRSIAQRTIKLITNAEGFGDSVSGIHGMSGLAWQASKAQIERAREQFNQTQFLNNPDWYNRYGFMYFNFIKESYQPPE
jgi:hypothetical protein